MYTEKFKEICSEKIKLFEKYFLSNDNLDCYFYSLFYEIIYFEFMLKGNKNTHFLIKSAHDAALDYIFNENTDHNILLKDKLETLNNFINYSNKIKLAKKMDLLELVNLMSINTENIPIKIFNNFLKDLKSIKEMIEKFEKIKIKDINTTLS